MIRKLLYGGFLIATLCGLCLAQEKPLENNDALVIYSSGLDGILVDPKDRGLANALRLLDERVNELPEELDGADIPVPIIELLLELIFKPMSLQAGMINPNQAAGGPPFYAQLNFYSGDDEEAIDVAGRFAELFGIYAPIPSLPAEGRPGLNMIDLDGVPVYHGALNVAGEPTFAIALNKLDEVGLKLNGLNLPGGVNPAFAFHLDFQKLQAPLHMLMAMAGPQAGMLRQQLDMMGVFGEQAMTVTAACGYSADRSHFAFKCSNYRHVMEKTNATPDRMLTQDDLRPVPVDATFAQISRFNISSMLSMFELMAQMEGLDEEVDPLAMAEEHLGFHPKHDLLDHLGQTLGIYMSDTTGGGGLLSMACFIELKNKEGLQESISKLTNHINDAAGIHAKGYVRISSKKVNNHEILMLTFPGLPIPLELSIGMTDSYLFGALNPQGLFAAMDQATNGTTCILDNARFKEMGGLELDDAIQVEFFDTPRLISGGYGLVSLGMAALANAVRSPSDVERDAGFIMPSYNELANGAKATVGVYRIIGDDLVGSGQGDRSLMVNACGTVSLIGAAAGPLVVAAVAGTSLPALGKARQKAKAAKSGAQLRGIHQSSIVFHREFEKSAGSIQDLVNEGYVSDECAESPLGPSADGGDDYWFDFSEMTDEEIAHSDERIVGYDRAMYVSENEVAVVFLDGHAEVISIHRFSELINQPPNAGVDFDLPFDE